MNETKSDLSDYDVRQILLMKDLVLRLMGRNIELNKFLNDQWTLIDLLETVDDSWAKSYLERVNSIEIILATGLEEGSTRLSSSDEKEIDDIAKSLLDSIDSLLKLPNSI